MEEYKGKTIEELSELLEDLQEQQEVLFDDLDDPDLKEAYDSNEAEIARIKSAMGTTVVSAKVEEDNTPQIERMNEQLDEMLGPKPTEFQRDEEIDTENLESSNFSDLQVDKSIFFGDGGKTKTGIMKNIDIDTYHKMRNAEFNKEVKAGRMEDTDENWERFDEEYFEELYAKGYTIEYAKGGKLGKNKPYNVDVYFEDKQGNEYSEDRIDVVAKSKAEIKENINKVVSKRRGVDLTDKKHKKVRVVITELSLDEVGWEQADADAQKSIEDYAKGGYVPIIEVTEPRSGKRKEKQIGTEETYREALKRVEKLNNKNTKPDISYITGPIYEKGGKTSKFWEKTKSLGRKGYKKSKELAHEANERRKSHLHFKRKEISRNVGIETTAIIDDKVKKGEITKKRADKLNDTLVDAAMIEEGLYTYPEGPKANYEVKDMAKNLNPMDPYYAKGGEIKRFDRHESMPDETRDEISYLLNGRSEDFHPYRITDTGLRAAKENEYWNEKQEDELRNYLFGLYDGYNYSHTENFKKVLSNLKKSDIKTGNRVEKLFNEVDKYPKAENAYEYERGGEVKWDFSEEEVIDGANNLATALTILDGELFQVHDFEYDKGKGAGFELSIDDEKYAGGSYYIDADGTMINAAMSGAPYGNIKDSKRELIKASKSFAKGGETATDYSGEYRDLRTFVMRNGLREAMGKKYGFEAKDYEDYVRGELGYDTEVIQELAGDRYKVDYIERYDEETGRRDKDGEGVIIVSKSYAKGGLLDFDVLVNDRPLIQISKDNFLETYNVSYYQKEKIPSSVLNVLESRKQLTRDETIDVLKTLRKNNVKIDVPLPFAKGGELKRKPTKEIKDLLLKSNKSIRDKSIIISKSITSWKRKLRSLEYEGKTEDSKEWKDVEKIIREQEKLNELNYSSANPSLNLKEELKNYAKGGEIEIVNAYNEMNLPKDIYSNGNIYEGKATFINGYNGYTSTKDDGYLIDEKGNYLTDKKGNNLVAKERRGVVIDLSKYAKGGKTKHWKDDKYWADYTDIGIYSMDRNWSNSISEEEFYKIGKDIVDTQFKGDIGNAWDSIVKGKPIHKFRKGRHFRKGGKVSDKRQYMAEFMADLMPDDYMEALGGKEVPTFEDGVEWELENRIKTDADAEYYGEKYESSYITGKEYAKGGVIFYDIYDDETNKTLYIKAHSLEEAEGIAETLDWDSEVDGNRVDVLDDMANYEAMEDYAKGGETASPITNYRRTIMGTLGFDLKVKGMRKPQGFIVYPITEKTDKIRIQSDKKWGEIHINSGKGILSKSGSTSWHLHADMMNMNVIKFELTPEELEELKTQIKSTSGKDVGNTIMRTDNSGAALLEHGGEIDLNDVSIYESDENGNFTVVIDGDVFDMNYHTMPNMSVNMYAGSRSEYPSDISHWGKKITFEDAPQVIKDKIGKRIEEFHTHLDKGGKIKEDKRKWSHHMWFTNEKPGDTYYYEDAVIDYLIDNPGTFKLDINRRALNKPGKLSEVYKDMGISTSSGYLNPQDIKQFAIDNDKYEWLKIEGDRGSDSRKRTIKKYLDRRKKYAEYGEGLSREELLEQIEMLNTMAWEEKDDEMRSEMLAEVNKMRTQL